METQKWSKTEIQLDQRSDHQAILLNPAQILLIGGRSGRLIRPEIINTGLGSRSPRSAENLSTILKTNTGQEKNRWGFAACHSQELNLIFIGGGCNSEYIINRCHLFKCFDDGFKEVEGVPDLPCDEVLWPSATFGPDHVYVYGGQRDWRVGQGGYSGRVLKLDLKTLKWSEVRISGAIGAPSPRSQSYTFFSSGKLFVYGGCDGRNIRSDLHALDPTTGDWAIIRASGQHPTSLGNLILPPKDQEPPDFTPLASFSPPEALNVLNHDFSTGRHRLLRLDMRNLNWTVVKLKRDLKMTCQSSRLLVNDSILYMVDGSSGQGSGNGQVSSLKLTNRLTWNQERILWLACFKNNPEECCLAKCPPMIIYKIIDHANAN